MSVARHLQSWARRDVNLAFWVGAVSYLTLTIARRTFLSATGIAAIWPASGVLAAALVLSPRRYWKWLLLLGVVGNIVTNGVFGFSSRTLLSLPEAGLLAWLIHMACPRTLNFADPKTLGLFVLKAVIPACLVSAVGCYFLPVESPAHHAEHTTVAAAFGWFTGHALGATIAVPVMVILLRPRRYRVFSAPAWELWICTAVILVYAVMLFGGHSAVLALIMFPMAMVVAFRYGPIGASTVSTLMTGLALTHIYAGIPGPRPANDDQIQWVQVFVAVVFVTSMPAAGALASLHRTRRLLADRTQIARRARRRADEAAAAKTLFLANMSHEIRTPLNGVIGLADVLSRTELNARQKDMVDMICGSGRALNGILSDVLDLTRVDAGGLSLTLEAFDAREAVHAACYLFEATARQKDVAFIVEFDVAQPGRVVGDALRIRQIVSNLISNAVKFTAAGEVRIKASIAANPTHTALADVTVSVSDTGPGFSDEVKARLFRRFEQADGTITRSFGGAGLGLAISRELAALMDGRIDCQSEAGKGATFTLRLSLPLASREEPNVEVAPAEMVEARGEQRLKLLLAEDHIVNQRVIQAILGGSVDLTIVDNGQAAVEACQSCAFDLILMDNQMPVMDGLSAIRAIRALERQDGRRRTPVFSLTADAMPHQVAAALAAGADRHLPKPITANGLIGALAATLSSQAA